MRNFTWVCIFVFYSVLPEEDYWPIFLCTTGSTSDISYYDILNTHLEEHALDDKIKIDMSSSQRDLRKVYLNLSHKLHPDKNSHSDATKQFQDLNAIYETLRDEESRRVYDASLQPTLLKRVLSCFLCNVSLFTTCESKFD
ncbi:MAG: J domain-containing protein [Candidatus Dependentiae bacterium]